MFRVSSDDAEDNGIDYDGIQDFLSDTDDERDERKLNQQLNEEIEAKFSSSLTNRIIFVANLPIIETDTQVDLMKTVFIRRLFASGIDVDPQTVNWDICIDEDTGKYAGCGFLQFESDDYARKAAQSLDYYSMDKKHVLAACLLNDYENVLSGKSSAMPLALSDKKGLFWWLKSEKTRGLVQFVCRHKKLTEIYWHDAVGRKPILINQGEASMKADESRDAPPLWTRGKVDWSPNGCYFVTFHKPGIAVWGKSNFEKLARFEHEEVKEALFSPDENYIITFSGDEKSKGVRPVKFWRMLTHQLVTTHMLTPICGCDGADSWPYFSWSHDSLYIAALSPTDIGTIIIYSTPKIEKTLEMNFKLPPPKMSGNQAKDAKQGKGGDQVMQHLEFSWSPAANILSVFIPEKGESPSRLVLYEIPSKREVSSKNLYYVKNASMAWQSKGQYMALLTHICHKKKNNYTQIEIFRVKDKNCPVDSIQQELAGLIVKEFSWESAGVRLAILVEDEATRSRCIKFYSVYNTGATLLVTTFDVSSHMNTIRWSPLGSNFIVAAANGDGSLLFASLTDGNKVDVYQRDDHYQLNEIQWDPTGRYVCTAVALSLGCNSNWKLTQNAGYQIWTFQGRLQNTFKSEEFYIFRWRPHPPSLLSPQKERAVHKRLKDFSKRFDETDEALKQEKRAEFRSERKQICDIFMASVEEARKWALSHHLHDEWETAAQELESQYSFEEKSEKIEEVVESGTMQLP